VNITTIIHIGIYVLVFLSGKKRSWFNTDDNKSSSYSGLIDDLIFYHVLEMEDRILDKYNFFFYVGLSCNINLFNNSLNKTMHDRLTSCGKDLISLEVKIYNWNSSRCFIFQVFFFSFIEKYGPMNIELTSLLMSGTRSILERWNIKQNYLKIFMCTYRTTNLFILNLGLWFI